MTRIALQNDRVTLVALLVIVVAGLGSFFTLPQDEDPGFIIRTAVVITRFPGASPDRVEQLITDKIEEVVQEIPELDFLLSESRTGVSIVNVNIKESYKEMRPIWDNLRRKVDRAREGLPEGVIGPIVNDEFGDVFGILLTLTGEGYTYAELKKIADQVREELLLLEEISKVEIYGAQEERVFIEYNDARLAELNLSVRQLGDILAARNIIMPGGQVRIANERIFLEPSGNFETIEDMGRTVIKLPGRQEVLYLGDLATITRGYVDPPLSIVHASGVPALGIGISMRDGGNILSLGEQVGATIRSLESRYPIGIEFTKVADQPGRVQKKVDEFVGNLLQAIAIVVLVMLVSLGLRTGLVVASLIPSAMLMSLLVMSFAGIGLNQMSLASLIIALGMLIDNAIVMSESILVQMKEGKSPFKAAVDSGAELRVPLLTSSLTTGAAFLPIALAKSSTGEYTGVLFWVVTTALLCSWVLALTSTPLLCARFLKVSGNSKEEAESIYRRLYRRTLVAVLKHRTVALLAAAAVFFAALYAFRFVPVIFFPTSDRSFFYAEMHLPMGTAIESTEEMVYEVERFLGEELKAVPGTEGRQEGVTSWVAFIGGGEPRYILNANPEQANPAYAFLLINTTGFEAVQPAVEKLQDFCGSHFPDLVATILPSGMGPPIQKPVQVRVSGRETDRIFELAGQIADRLEGIPGSRNVGLDWGRRTKKILVEIDQPRARRAGVTSQDVAVSLQSLLSGLESTQYREKSDIIPVTLRSVATDRQDIGKLETLNVYSQTTGNPVPLRQVANLEVVWEPSEIRRRDRVQTLTVESDLLPGVTANEVNAQLLPWLEEESEGWPLGYRYELGGEVETSGKANASIAEQLPVAGLIILLLLVGQFNSVRKPVIIVATIPLGLIGVIIGLLVARSYFGFMTLLGIISLAGIVINNAIVLIDRFRIEMVEYERPPQEAIVEACLRRFRPILLTTMTTVGGLIPLWLGGGPMWEPMAVAIIFGLLFASALTLGLVPVLYSLLFRVSFAGYR